MDDYPFHVGYNWKNDQTVTLVNIPNHYEFEKTDHRRKPLSGVRFGLYDDKGTFIRELVSDENGIVRADNLVPGSYLIRETRRWTAMPEPTRQSRSPLTNPTFRRRSSHASPTRPSFRPALTSRLRRQ